MRDKLAQLPDSPGVYLFRDNGGRIIYVGKAVSLKNRVKSYFSATVGHLPKVRAMMERAADFEYSTTDSEVEALILEANLIKEHYPKYNISLRDDKSYPYIKITVHEQFPRMFMTRRVVKDGSRYLGPYTHVGAVHETLKLLKNIFPLRSCRDQILGLRSRPCLNQHIKRCLGPCCGLVTAEEYRKLVDGVLLFLEGKQSDLAQSLRRNMEEAAEQMDFERAAQLRDQLLAVEQVMERQKIVSVDNNDRDVLAMAKGLLDSCVMLFFVRGGKLVGRDHYLLRDTAETDRDEVMTGFIKQYYLKAEFIPREVLTQAILPDEINVLEQWLSEKRGGRVYLAVPKRGDKKRLLDLAGRNALLVLQEEENRRALRKDELQQALEQLAQALELKKPPLRMECFDISNTQGTDSVASMAVFEGGKPAPEHYRRFKIRTVEGPDDFASMREVLTRRLSRGKEERQLVNTGQMSSREAKFYRLPDLLVVDGGKGQLSSAIEVLKEQGLGDLSVCGLAKEEELIFLPQYPNPVRLAMDSPALQMLRRLRDEAHRFAVAYHRTLRGKRNLKFMLEEIEGIGAVRRRELLKAFGSVSKIRSAALEELSAVPGMNQRSARAVYDFFKE